MFHHLHSCRNTVHFILWCCFIPDSVMMEVALFHFSCMKGTLTQATSARYPSRDHWQLPENWIFYPSPWRNLQTPQPYLPWRQSWMLLGEELAHGEWWVPGISHSCPQRGWDMRLGMQKWIFLPAKLSWDFPLAKWFLSSKVWWYISSSGGLATQATSTKSVWLHFHLQELQIIINTNLI